MLVMVLALSAVAVMVGLFVWQSQKLIENRTEMEKAYTRELDEQSKQHRHAILEKQWEINDLKTRLAQYE